MLDERTVTAKLDRLPPPGVFEPRRSGSFVGRSGRPARVRFRRDSDIHA